MRYLDTGLGHPDHTLGIWLKQGLAGTPTGLWIQSGYFGYESLAVHDAVIGAIAAQGDPVHVVLGANQGSLSADDLRRLFAAVGAGPHRSITVIAYANALFHPKAYVVRRGTDEYFAYVGSANMTGPGVGLNVEAGIALSTVEGDDPQQIGAIVQSIESWPSREQDGVFRIEKPDDIDELAAAGFVSLVSERTTRRTTSRTGSGSTNPGRGAGQRLNLYPTAPLASFTGVPSTPPAPVPRGSALHWSKVMRSSDAQQVRANSNVTGKLRLAKAGHNIDHKTWFREVFFDGIEWATEMRGGKAYEVAAVPFQVTIDGVDLGDLTLKVDHAPHRVAEQNNVPTVLAWGHDIGRILVGTSHIGATVALDRTAEGIFKLTID